MRLTLETNSAGETEELGRKIGGMLRGGEIIAMQGTLAAGKTTMTKGIAAALGIDETVTSPTFCLVAEYEGRLPLHHLDVYRLSGAEDFLELGAEEFMYGGGVTIIEWSEKIMSELPENTIVLKIEAEEGSDRRRITIDNWPHGEIN